MLGTGALGAVWRLACIPTFAPTENRGARRKYMSKFLPIAALFCCTALLQGAVSEKSLTRMQRQVRHELVMLPYYGVFDNLLYTVGTDGTITLKGQVTRPTLKSSAENVVKDVEG